MTSTVAKAVTRTTVSAIPRGGPTNLATATAAIANTSFNGTVVASSAAAPMQKEQQLSTTSAADGNSTMTTTMPSDDGARADRGKSFAMVAAGATAGGCFFLFLLSLVYFLRRRKRSRHGRVAVGSVPASVMQNSTFMIHMSDLDPAPGVGRGASHRSSGGATALSTHTYSEIADRNSSTLPAPNPGATYIVPARAPHSGLAPAAGYTALNLHHSTYNGMPTEPGNVEHEPRDAPPQRKVTLRHPHYVNVAADTDSDSTHGDSGSKATSSHLRRQGAGNTSDGRSHEYRVLPQATGYTRLMTHKVYDASQV